jgi:hypothetical protein
MIKYSLSVASVADPDPVGSSSSCRILIQTCYLDPYPFQPNVKLNYTGTGTFFQKITVNRSRF